MMRVLPVSGSFSAISSSISTLSRSARITTRGFCRFALASTSSERMVKILGDHPRISV
jgi:hypothetical protein